MGRIQDWIERPAEAARVTRIGVVDRLNPTKAMNYLMAASFQAVFERLRLPIGATANMVLLIVST